MNSSTAVLWVMEKRKKEDIRPGKLLENEGIVECKIAVRPYSIKELRNIYHVSDKTFKIWLRKLEHQVGEKMGACYTVRQVELIFSELGVPYVVSEKKNM